MDFLSDGNILLVGDGDFSFSVALSKYPQFQADKVTSSNLETPISISSHAQAAENMKILEDQGVSVFLEVDARDLHNHDVINKKKYDKIIFNFPLADRHNIKKNRALLADFFVSCSHILTATGQVMVTLCKGQGGTPADQPVRSWHDSWQVVAMATNAGFLLQSVVPFDASCFPEYHSVGFRFQDKSFNTSGSLTHIFYMAELIKVTDSGVRGTVSFQDQIYSCSQYVCDKMKRDLLSEPGSPVSLLKNHIVSRLMGSLKCHRYVPCPPMLLPGFKSYVHLMKNPQMKACSEIDDCLDTTEMKLEKERKNQETFDKLQKNSFNHGVKKVSPSEILSEDGASEQTFFLPFNDEDVYVLIRTSNSSLNQPIHSENSHDEGDNSHELDECNLDNSEAVVTSLNNEKVSISYSLTNHSSPVFHHRVSLLENLLEIWEEQLSSSKNSEEDTSSQTYWTENLSSRDRNQDLRQYLDCVENQASNSHSLQQGRKYTIGLSDVSFCFITDGQSLMPGPIKQNFLPAKQELMIVQQINNRMNIQTEPSTITSTHNLLSKSNMNKALLHSLQELSHQVLSSIENSQYLSQGFHISTKPNTLGSFYFQGFDHSDVAEDIFLETQNHSCIDRSKVDQNLPIGHVLYTQKGESLLHIILLSLSDFACQLWSIDDKRLLWCREEKFLSQFRSLCPTQKFEHLCLYPMKFVHDVSFWENIDGEFNVANMYETIHNIAGDIVVHVSLVDSYICDITKRRSRCYRLYFESHFQALPYLTSWKLQSQIRMEMARTLGITLR